MQAVVIDKLLACPPELVDKILFLNTPNILDVKYTENQLQTLELSFC